MKAIIMAGGFGTRLRPLTCTIPKPMVPMANRPMMEHIVRLLIRHHFHDVISLLYYHPAVIRNYFGDGSDFGITMQYMQAEADYGTAGSVRNAAEKIGDEDILIISGDVLTDFDLSRAIAFHKEQNADATLVLTHVPNPLQFGVVMVNDQGIITRFLEKPSWGEVFSDTINTGIYILKNRVLQMIPYREDFDFSKNLFPLMLQEGMKLCGYVAEGYWRDVGNLNEYQEAAMDCLAGSVAVDFKGTDRNGAWVDEGANYEPTAIASRGQVLIGRNSRIAPSARIINSMIGEEVEVHDGAVIENTVIWNRCVIEGNVHLSNCVVGNEVTFRENSTVDDNVFISDQCTIGRGALLRSNIKLWPMKTVQDGAILSKSLVWEDKWLKELFTDARITGSANIELNPEFGAKLGAALGAFVGEGKMVLASRDPDSASRMLKRAITSGLMSSGVNINDMQTVPIPMIRQELRNGRNVAGFHVRKSPFDASMLDIIFFDGDGKDLPQGKTKSIERQFFSEDFQRASYHDIGTISFPERTTESYRERFFSSLDSMAIAVRGLNAVIDYSYGIVSTIFPNILGNLGIQVVSLNAYVDAQHLTRSTQEFLDAKEQVSRIVTSLSYDAGFLIDAGGEKIFVVKNDGTFFSDNRLLSVVTWLFLETARLQGRVVKKIGVPIAATSEVQLVAANFGVEVVFTTNTHGGMMNAVLSDPEIAFVGGTRGGFIFPEFLFATDGMFNIAKILELVALSGHSLQDADQQVERLARTEREVYCDWDSKGKVMRHAMKHSETLKRVLIDGIKIIRDDRTWVLLIPSKEHALFHLYVEAPDQETANALADEYQHCIVQWRDNP